jgi:hypothetical protein
MTESTIYGWFDQMDRFSHTDNLWLLGIIMDLIQVGMMRVSPRLACRWTAYHSFEGWSWCRWCMCPCFRT